MTENARHSSLSPTPLRSMSIFEQSAPLVGREKSPVSTSVPGIRSSVAPRTIRCFYISAAHAVHFAGRHAVERGRIVPIS